MKYKLQFAVWIRRILVLFFSLREVLPVVRARTQRAKSGEQKEIAARAAQLVSVLGTLILDLRQAVFENATERRQNLLFDLGGNGCKLGNQLLRRCACGSDAAAAAAAQSHLQSMARAFDGLGGFFRDLCDEFLRRCDLSNLSNLSTAADAQFRRQTMPRAWNARDLELVVVVVQSLAFDDKFFVTIVVVPNAIALRVAVLLLFFGRGVHERLVKMSGSRTLSIARLPQLATSVR